MLLRTLITEITYLFSVRLASFRWQELYSGLVTDLGKLRTNVRLPFKDSLVVKGKCTMETIQRQNTEVVYRGRRSRISDEVSVMEMERRA
jgi:hypothetical protein